MSNICENCLNFTYDEDYECFSCEIDLDEDEMYRFLKNDTNGCPYFSFNNEYAMVHRQI